MISSTCGPRHSTIINPLLSKTEWLEEHVLSQTLLELNKTSTQSAKVQYTFCIHSRSMWGIRVRPIQKKSQILLLENSKKKKNINIWFPLCHSRQSRPKLKFKMSSQLITTYKSLKNTSQVLKMAQSRRVQKFCIHSRSMLVPSKNVQILLHENSKKEKNINTCFPLCHNWQPRPKLKCKNELSLHAKP